MLVVRLTQAIMPPRASSGGRSWSDSSGRTMRHSTAPPVCRTTSSRSLLPSPIVCGGLQGQPQWREGCRRSGSGGGGGGRWRPLSGGGRAGRHCNNMRSAARCTWRADRPRSLRKLGVRRGCSRWEGCGCLQRCVGLERQRRIAVGMHATAVGEHMYAALRRRPSLVAATATLPLHAAVSFST